MFTHSDCVVKLVFAEAADISQLEQFLDFKNSVDNRHHFRPDQTPENLQHQFPAAHNLSTAVSGLFAVNRFPVIH
jgi:hypothetical protein